jgi:hypothetical protein
MYLFFEIITFIFFISQTYEIAFEKCDFDKWFFSGFQAGLVLALSILGMFQPVFLLPIHIFMVFLNRTTWELGRGKRITYLKNWSTDWSPFSKGCCENAREFICMSGKIRYIKYL